jgi:hypothetical protein
MQIILKSKRKSAINICFLAIFEYVVLAQHISSA